MDTDEADQRLELLHQNLRKYGTVFHTLAVATALCAKTVAREMLSLAARSHMDDFVKQASDLITLGD